MPTASPLHIVSGKGGTGKSTVSVALARMLARGGGDVLLCEVEARHGLSDIAGIRPVPPGSERSAFADGGDVRILSVDAKHALTDYLATHFTLGPAGVLLEKSGFTDLATDLAPGLRDVLLIGKVYQSARRRLKGQDSAVDDVVLDAPPTGRLEAFLSAGEALAQVVSSGPIHDQANSIMALLRSPDTRVHLVATPSEMSVTETMSTLATLRRLRIAPGRLIANQVLPNPGELPATLAQQYPKVAAAAASAKARAAAQDPWLAQLKTACEDHSLGELIVLPEFAGEPTRTDLIRLADDLQAAWGPR